MVESSLTGFQSTAVFIIVLSVLIIVHEWGHFITAKKLGINVQRFALGFGPTLLSFTYNRTTYMINAIPLGGYVKMEGDERSECTGAPGEFYSKPVGHRALVVFNGPLVNFVLAYLSFVFVFMLGYPGQSTVIAHLKSGGPAQTAGFQVGDKIVSVNGRRTYGWMNLESRLEGTNPDGMNITAFRKGEYVTHAVYPNIEEKPNMVGRKRFIRDVGISNSSNVIGGFVEGYPAEKAGLEVGDRIIAVNGNTVNDWSELQKAIASSTGETINIRALREQAPVDVTVSPKITDIEEDGKTIQRRQIGIGPQHELDLYRFGFMESLANAGEELWFITALTYESLFRMVTGSMSAKESVTGPVGIFYIVKGAAESGLSHLLFIVGIISASLAIFNLLPVIPLDGGHLFLFGLEKVRGKALSARVDDYIARAGFSLIILLAIFVFYSDFARFGWFDHIGKWFGQIGKLF